MESKVGLLQWRKLHVLVWVDVGSVCNSVFVHYVLVAMVSGLIGLDLISINYISCVVLLCSCCA